MKHKRYLFNCLKDPRTATRLNPGWWSKLVEKNPGDLAYEYSVMNALALDESFDFIPTGYYHFRGFSKSKIEQINATCDAFICPLADVFSDEFLPLLSHLTDLIRQLQIPCVVPCVGLRASNGVWAAHSQEFDQVVDTFVRTVLERSAIIGVRGETTAHYLEKLGFSRSRHFVVVGCPSMYTYGETLPVRAINPPQDFNRCAFSLNQRANERDWRFIDGVAEQFRESYFVSQHWLVFRQFMLTNCRHPSPVVETRPFYKQLLLKYASQDRMRFFLNRKPWMEFLGGMNLSFGHRIHGALLSVLAGTPAVVVPFETRTEELARFHGIPIVSASDKLGDWQNGNLKRQIAEINFSEPAKRQKENFANWLSFLHANGLETVFDNMEVMKSEIVGRRDFPLERSLPDEFPDDNIRAWDFNSTSMKTRMSMAVAGAWCRGCCGLIAQKGRALIAKVRR